jgi:hypothetical protein
MKRLFLFFTLSLVGIAAEGRAPTDPDGTTRLVAELDHQYAEALTRRLCESSVFRNMGQAVIGQVAQSSDRQHLVADVVERLPQLCRMRVEEMLQAKQGPYAEFRESIRDRLATWPVGDLEALVRFRATEAGRRYSALLTDLDEARAREIGPWINDYANSLYADMQLVLRAEVGPADTVPSPSRPAIPPARFRNAADLGDLCAEFYPALSRRLGEEGVVLLYVKLDPAGHLNGVHLATSSGHPDLDVAAAACVATHARFVPPEGGSADGSWFAIRWNWRLSDP